MKKIIPFIIFFALILFLFIYMIINGYESDKAVISDEDMKEYENYNDKEELIDSRLNFDKDIQFIYIGEMNNNAIHYPIIENLVIDEVSINEETESIYLYNQDLIPYENTQMMIVFDTYNLGNLLYQQIDKASSNSISHRFSSLGHENYEESPINDEGRLFLDNELLVEIINEQGDIKITLDKEEVILSNGSTEYLNKAQGSTKSRLIVTNYGQWNSKDIKFVLNNQE